MNKERTFLYCDCGNEMDTDCNGEPRCDVCDAPCPCCSDGEGPTIFDDVEFDQLEETVDMEL